MSHNKTNTVMSAFSFEVLNLFKNKRLWDCSTLQEKINMSKLICNPRQCPTSLSVSLSLFATVCACSADCVYMCGVCDGGGMPPYKAIHVSTFVTVVLLESSL